MNITQISYQPHRDYGEALSKITIDITVNDVADDVHVVDFDVIAERFRGLAFHGRSGTAMADNIISNWWNIANKMHDDTNPIEEYITGTLTGLDGALISLNVLSTADKIAKVTSVRSAKSSYRGFAKISCGDAVCTPNPVIQISLRPDASIGASASFATTSAEQYAHGVTRSIFTRFGF